ncbi:MAG: hypothetical protein AAF378_02430 [Cyanobacteria bacterium P01_A01_bin.84]
MLKARPVYQYYAQQPDQGYRYFYSLDKDVKEGWTLDENYNEAIAFYAFKHKLPGTVPVYQYYYQQKEGGVRYFYSTDRNVEACWTLDENYKDGIAFYACDKEILGTEPIYQYYYQQEAGDFRHFYSKDPNANHGWTLDKEYKDAIAFYAF